MHKHIDRRLSSHGLSHACHAMHKDSRAARLRLLRLRRLERLLQVCDAHAAAQLRLQHALRVRTKVRAIRPTRLLFNRRVSAHVT